MPRACLHIELQAAFYSNRNFQHQLPLDIKFKATYDVLLTTLAEIGQYALHTIRAVELNGIDSTPMSCIHTIAVKLWPNYTLHVRNGTTTPVASATVSQLAQYAQRQSFLFAGCQLANILFMLR